MIFCVDKVFCYLLQSFKHAGRQKRGLYLGARMRVLAVAALMRPHRVRGATALPNHNIPIGRVLDQVADRGGRGGSAGPGAGPMSLHGDGINDELFFLLWAKDDLNYGPSINVPDTVIYKFGQPVAW